MAEETTAPETATEEPIKLTLVRATFNIDLENEEGGTTKYILREMSGTTRDRWMNKTQTKMKTNSEGKAVGVRDYTGLHSSLIAHCLFTPEGVAVPEQTIQEFPSSLQNYLFKKCQKMNGLDNEGNEEAKKD